MISVPSHCRKDKKVLMVPNFGKSHFVEIGRPVFSAVGKLWVVSLALGTRTQRRVARSSYTTSSTTPPPTHPPKNILLRQIKCYFTPKPPTPHKNKSQSCPVGLYHQFHHTTHPTTFVEDFQTHFLKRPEQRYLDFNFYF